MSRIAFLTRVLAFSHVVPPSRSSVGRVGAGELLHEVEPLDRDEELVLAGVAELHELLRDRGRPSIRFRPTNTPMPWSTWTTRSPTFRSRKSDRNVRVAERRRSWTLPLFLEDVGLGPELKLRLRQAEAARQMADADEHGGGMARPSPRFDRHREDVVVGEQLDRPLGAAGRVRDEDHRVAALAAAADLFDPVRHAAGELERPADTRCGRRRSRPRASVSSAVAPDSHDGDGVPLEHAVRTPAPRAGLSRSPPRSWRPPARAPCGRWASTSSGSDDEQRRLGTREVVEDGSGAVEHRRDRRAVPAAERSPPDPARTVDRCVAGS